MICKDCIHYSVCHSWFTQYNEICGGMQQAIEACRYYKAESRIIELPKSEKPIHTKYTVKSSGRLQHTMYCGKCGEFRSRVCYGDKYCRECGTKIDWSEEK